MLEKIMQIGNKVEISDYPYYSKEYSFENALVSKVESLDKDILAITAPIKKTTLYMLDEYKSYYITIYGDYGIYSTKVKMVGKYKEENILILQLELLSQIEKIQRRQFFRLECMLYFKYRDESNTQWHEATMLDLSGGGMRFVSNRVLEKSKEIMCHLVFEGEEVSNLYIISEIIASDESINDKNYIINRTRFINIENKDREKIVKFIFEEQRRRRSSLKGV